MYMQTSVADYSIRFTLQADEVDFTGRWRPSAILRSMQNLATAHAELIGVGRDVMLQRNIIWLLSRTHLQMQAYPMMDEEVVLRTWPGEPNRFFFPRHFTIARPDGQPLGAASTLWVLLDLGARAIIPPGKCDLVFPDTSHLSPPLPAPERVMQVEGERLLDIRTARYSDLDVNRHVNNTRYADWLCDALPMDTMATHCIENLLLNYTKEILPGETLRTTLALEDNRFSMSGDSQDGTRTFFEIGGTLLPWHSDRRV
jgi:acyl-ACP thioesterase